MAEQIPPEAYRQILVNESPLIDLRAPVEFQRGAFPHAVNLPLIEDAEREAIGKRYREAGQQAAIELGMTLVNGTLREQRLQRWIAQLDARPDSLLYCFRGGLRSRLAQDWLAEAGYKVPRISGGYKALRRFLIDYVEETGRSSKFLVVGGRTGSDKTGLLNRLPGSIDLEGLAHHRGSAFGRRTQPQPTQIDFENSLAIALLRLPRQQSSYLLVEDESHAIGSLSIPLPVYRPMSEAPLAIIEESMSRRVEVVRTHYIEANFQDFTAIDPDSAEDQFREYLTSSLRRIKPRLQQVGYEELQRDMIEALQSHFRDGTPEAHDSWIEKLLRYYYDPMYDYQLNKKSTRIVFRGSGDEFLRWARALKTVA